MKLAVNWTENSSLAYSFNVRRLRTYVVISFALIIRANRDIGASPKRPFQEQENAVRFNSHRLMAMKFTVEIEQ